MQFSPLHFSGGKLAVRKVKSRLAIGVEILSTHYRGTFC